MNLHTQKLATSRNFHPKKQTITCVGKKNYQKFSHVEVYDCCVHVCLFVDFLHLANLLRCHCSDDDMCTIYVGGSVVLTPRIHKVYRNFFQDLD